MKISIVIPLYNKEAHIRNTLEHIIGQSFQDFEVIVINDGSTDSSEEEVKSVTDSRIHLYSQENHGVSYTRNRGVDLSSGELIAFLDADDEWEPDYLQCQYDLYKRYPDAVAYGTNYYIIENEKKYVLTFPNIKDNCGILTDYFVSGKSYTPLWTSAIMIKKSTFIDLGGFPLNYKLCEDIDLWCRLACTGEIAYLNEPHAVYHRNSTNMASRATDTTCYFPFLDDYKKYESIVSSTQFQSIKRYVEYRRLNAVSYALLVAENPKLARNIIHKIKNETLNKKKLYGYYIMSFCPKWALRFYVKRRKQRKNK